MTAGQAPGPPDEVWFGIIEPKPSTVARSARSKTSTPRSTPSSTAGTTEPIPFVWTKTADQILAKAKRPTTINSGH